MWTYAYTLVTRQLAVMLNLKTRFQNTNTWSNAPEKVQPRARLGQKTGYCCLSTLWLARPLSPFSHVSMCAASSMRGQLNSHLHGKQTRMYFISRQDLLWVYASLEALSVYGLTLYWGRQQCSFPGASTNSEAGLICRCADSWSECHIILVIGDDSVHRVMQ